MLSGRGPRGRQRTTHLEEKGFPACFSRIPSNQAVTLEVGSSVYPTFNHVRRDVVELFKIDEDTCRRLVEEDDEFWYYEYERAQLWKKAPMFDPRLPDFREEYTLISNDKAWEEATKDMPWDVSKWSEATVAFLVKMLNFVPDPSIEEDVQKQHLYQVRFEGLCGLWELASDKSTHPKISKAMLKGLVHTIRLQDVVTDAVNLKEKVHQIMSKGGLKRALTLANDGVLDGMMAYKTHIHELSGYVGTIVSLKKWLRQKLAIKHTTYRPRLSKVTHEYRVMHTVAGSDQQSNEPDVELENDIPEIYQAITASVAMETFRVAACTIGTISTTLKLRHALLALGGIEALLHILQTTFKESKASEGSICDEVMNMHVQLLTALSILVCDGKGRQRFYSMDGKHKSMAATRSTGWRVLTDYAVHAATPQIRKLAAYILCSVLNFDLDARHKFHAFGGLAHVKSLILCEKDDPDQSTNMEERKHSTDHDPGSFVAAASIVAQYGKDEQGRKQIIKSGIMQDIAPSMLSKIEYALAQYELKHIVYGPLALEQLIAALMGSVASMAEAAERQAKEAECVIHTSRNGEEEAAANLMKDSQIKQDADQLSATLSDLIPTYMHALRKALGMENGIVIIPDESLQIRLVSNLLSVTTTIGASQALMKFGGLALLQFLAGHTHHCQGVRNLALCAILRLAAQSEEAVPETKVEDQYAYLDKGMLGPFRDQLIAGATIELMLEIAHEALEVPPVLHEDGEQPDCAECNPMLEGASAVLMFMTATRETLQSSEIAGILRLCREAPHTARHFASAALWCAARNADNCTLLWNMSTLDVCNPSTSIPVFLHELLHLMWNFTMEDALDHSKQMLMAHAMWLLATVILLLHHSAAVRRQTSFQHTMYPRGMGGALLEEDPNRRSPEEDPLHLILLQVAVHLLQLGAWVGPRMDAVNFVSASAIHHLVIMSNDPRQDLLLPLVQPCSSGLLRIAAHEGHLPFVRRQCMSLYLVLCEACNCRADGTPNVQEHKDPVSAKFESPKEDKEGEQMAYVESDPVECETTDAPGVEDHGAEVKQAKEEKKKEPEEPQVEGKRRFQFDAPPARAFPDAMRPPDHHKMAVAFMVHTDESLQELGVMLCGHLAHQRKLSQCKLIAEGAAEVLCEFISQNNIPSNLFNLVLKALLNLSTDAEGQLRICKLILRPLLKINGETHVFDARERIRLSSGLLNNLFLNQGNRTRFYKEEIREKSKVIADQRFQLHQQHMRHVMGDGPLDDVEKGMFEKKKLKNIKGAKKQFLEWQQDVISPTKGMFGKRSQQEVPKRLHDDLSTVHMKMGAPLPHDTMTSGKSVAFKQEPPCKPPFRPAKGGMLPKLSFTKEAKARHNPHMNGKFMQEMNQPLQKLWKPMAGQNAGALMPMTRHGHHVITPGGSKDEVQIHSNPWKPYVRASVLGIAPKPRTGSTQFLPPPLMVQLGADGRARNRMQFDPMACQKPKTDEKDVTPCQLYMWKHTEGSVVHDELFPKYELSDGTLLYFYQSKKILVDEMSFEMFPPPPLPLSLELLDLPSMPQTTDVQAALTRIVVNLQAPTPLKPRPPALPKAATGFVSYNNTIPYFKITGAEVPEGLVVIKEPKPPPDEIGEEVSWEGSTFKTHKSVFAPRVQDADCKNYFNTRKVWNRAFTLDFGRMSDKSGLLKAVGGPLVMKQIEAVMEPHYALLHHLFNEMGANDEKMPYVVGLNTFNVFAVDCSFVDSDSQFCRQADVDTLFIVANLKEGDKNLPKNKLNPERSLSMFDFLDIIVRIAVAKYTKPPEFALSPPEALEKLVQDNIQPMCERSNLGVDPKIWRTERFYNEDNDYMFRAMYNYFKGLVRMKRLGLASFLLIFDQCKLIGEGIGVTSREVSISFMKSRMLVVDVFEKKEKNEGLGFVDFIEAMGRVADCLSLPSDDDLNSMRETQTLRAESSGSIPGDMKPNEDLDIFDFYKMHLSGLVALPRRPSAGMFNPKTRNITDKVDDMLEVVKGMLCEHYNQESSEKLQRFFVKECRFESGMVE